MAGAIWPSERMPVATWYSRGWKRWWLVRSMSVIRTGARLRDAGGEEPAEAAADDDHMVQAVVGLGARSQQPVHDDLDVVGQRHVPHLLGGEPAHGVGRAADLGPQRARPGRPPGR